MSNDENEHSEYEVVGDSPFKKLAKFINKHKEINLQFVKDLSARIRPVNVEAIEQFKHTGILHRINLLRDITLLSNVLVGLESCDSVERVKNLLGALSELKSDDIDKVLSKAEKQKKKNERLYMF